MSQPCCSNDVAVASTLYPPSHTATAAKITGHRNVLGTQKPQVPQPERARAA
jgi:hypothetical protein